MGTQKQHGFTIIEVLLFVAISAVVTTAALIGWSVNINTQSYRDSARSLASVLGQQYTNTLNVSNDRSGAQKCVDSTVEDTDNIASGTPIGQSDCVLMGRYIVMDGSMLTMSNIIGGEPGLLNTPDDILAISKYMPTVDKAVNSTSYRIPWSARPYPVNNKSTTLKVAIAIVRSPVSGTVYTFNKMSVNSVPSFQGLIDAGNQKKLTVCLDPGATVTGGSQAVVIDQQAASGSAVSVQSGAQGC